jgi:hypothetical protein
VLGVSPSNVSRAIRLGELRAVWLRGRLVISANTLTSLLGEPHAGGTP